MSLKKSKVKKISKKIVPTYIFIVEGKTEKNYFEKFLKEVKIEKVLKSSVEECDFSEREIKKKLSKINEDSFSKIFLIYDLDILLHIDSGAGNRLLLEKIVKILNEFKLEINDGQEIYFFYTFPDFEYFISAHFEDFLPSGVNKEKILKKLNYASLEKLKSDEKIYENIKNRGGTIEILLKKIPEGNIVENGIKIKYLMKNQLRNSSNIHKLYELIEKLDRKV